MASSILRRFRSRDSSPDDSNDEELDYPGFSDEPSPTTDKCHQEKSVPNDQGNEPRLKANSNLRHKQSHRLVFPLSSVMNLDLKTFEKKKTGSFAWKSMFSKDESSCLANQTSGHKPSDSKEECSQHRKECWSTHSSAVKMTHGMHDRKLPEGATPVASASNANTSSQSSTLPCSSTEDKGNFDVGPKVSRHRNLSDERNCSTSSRNETDVAIGDVCFSQLYPKAFRAWDRRRSKFLVNKIKTTKYTLLSFIPKNLFEQFHRFANFYFLLIIILNFLPMINSVDKYVAMIPLVAVLSMQAAKDIVEDFSRHKNDTRVNNQDVLIYDK